VLKSGGPINATGYSSTDVDKMIEDAAAEVDQGARKELYNQIRRKVLEDAPLAFVHYETINYLMPKNVTGSTINPTLELRMGNVSMA
jgi:peptide/nickel transport system substrate-binding protein